MQFPEIFHSLISTCDKPVVRNIDLRFATCVLIVYEVGFLNVYAKLVIITGGCDTMGKAVEICTRLGVRSGDDGQSMGRRDARSWHDKVPETHLWILYS